MNDKTSRMVFATAALAAVAALLAGPAGAQVPEGTGGQPVVAQPAGVHGALVNRDHGVVAASSDSRTLGLTGDSPLSRVSAPEPEGLTGDTALTRVSGNTPAPTFSRGEDFDWTSFGAGAGMVALVAAGIVGILLTARRRHTIGLP